MKEKDQQGFILTDQLVSSSPSLSFQPMRKEPEVVTVTLKKHNGMGLSIVAAKVGRDAPNGLYTCVCEGVSVAECPVRDFVVSCCNFVEIKVFL